MSDGFERKNQGTLSNNGSFILNDIKGEDAGTYVCEASNDVGIPIYKNFSVSVEGKTLTLTDVTNYSSTLYQCFFNVNYKI